MTQPASMTSAGMVKPSTAIVCAPAASVAVTGATFTSGTMMSGSWRTVRPAPGAQAGSTVGVGVGAEFGLCSGVGDDGALLAGPVVPADDEAVFPPPEQAASTPTMIIASKHLFTESRSCAIPEF
jgi:hypothetical protein